MPASELQDLLDLMDWSRTKLASELEITANAVDKWFQAGRVPGGPASILLIDWLALARQGLPLRPAKADRNGKPRRKEEVPA